MAGILGSKGFIEFYNKISTEAPSIQVFFKTAGNAMYDIVKDAKIGKCELFINSPQDPYDLKGTKDSAVIYEDREGFNENSDMRQTYITGDWGIIQIELYPKKDYEWTAPEEEEMEFLLKVIYDCCERVRYSILSKQAVITDTLTGACNRAGLIAYAGELHQKETIDEYTAIFYNIKNFGYVNQCVGTIEGDKALKDYARMVREFLDEGELLGRFGGDTFFILAKKDREKEVLDFIETRKIAVEVNKITTEFDMGVRAGVYEIRPGDNPVKVIDSAKIAYMFTRQPSNGDVVYFRDEMLEESLRDEEISNSFNRAMKRKEFVVYFQPKVDLITKEIVSCEALCRWVRDGEVVPPMEFIPTLERSGAICRLDYYVLERVCENIKEWKSKGIAPVKTSVNFSRSHILSRSLADKIVGIIDKEQVERKYIEIEITEMSGYGDFDQLAEFVDAMKDYGIETSIDDFGTGYSSLSLIKDLNVDTIKLDKSFLDSIDEAHEDQEKSVIKNIVNMVNELNMNVVAEGVETDAQMEFLKQVNCHTAQGFLFDKPLPKDDFESRLANGRVYGK